MNFNKLKTVSFDIFDTLVSRRIYRPTDLFALMQSKIASLDIALNFDDIVDHFIEIRIKAESDARQTKIKKFGGEPEILITDIYKEIANKYPSIDAVFIDFLIDLEISIEKKVLYKCEKGFELYTNALKSGCEVILISDMYLPSNVLRDLVTSCGYNVNGVSIFSSGEEGVSKSSGELFNIVKSKHLLNEKKWLHIGDNKKSDIVNAQKLGISTLYADWSQYSHDRSFHWKSKDVIGESIYKALSLTQASAHFRKDPLIEIGFKVFGPLMLGYMSWLTNQLITHKIDKALFLARDAHLIHKIFCKYFNEKSIDNEYIYLSRASTYMVGMTDWPMHRIWHLFGGKNKKSLLKILAVVGLDAKDHLSDIHNVGFPDENYVPQKGEEYKVYWLINKLFTAVLKKNTENRNEFSQYFRNACGDKKNIALIDVGWMGNIQSVFARSLGRGWADKNIHGFYLATFEGANDNKSLYNKMFGWLTNYGLPKHKNDSILSGGVELMEFAMADNTGSTIGYMKTESGIEPLRDETSSSEVEYLKKAALLQEGIISFFEYINPLLSLDNYNAFDSVILAEPFFDLIERPTSDQLEALASLTHAEAAGSNAERLPLVSKLSLKDRIFPGPTYNDGLQNSYWKEGYRRINRRKLWAKYE